MIKKVFLFALLLALLIFTRFYNLDKTARFIWDESSDLVNIHQIFVEKNLTLIGPISEDGNKVFGSLTYYMLLPFAVIGNFDPISTAYGAAFWGVLTCLLIIYLGFKVNKKALFFLIPITLLWYPLVETGRWAWNPNLITLSLIFYFKKSSLFKFLSGLSMGLTVHLHYLAIFTAAAFAIVILFESIKYKKLKDFFCYLLGLILALSPFVIFDITHPPGLFLSRILYFNNLGNPQATITFGQKLLNIIDGSFFYFGQSNFVKLILLILTTLIMVLDIKKKSPALKYLFVLVIQLVCLAFFANFYTHYILAVIPFFILYLIYPRQSPAEKMSYFILSVVIISSLVSFPKQISKISWESDIASTRNIVKIIEVQVKSKDMKNVNIAVLSSPDRNPCGKRYRDLLLIKGVNLKNKAEYEISDSLFVITTSPLEVVRKDPAYEIKFFQNGNLIEAWNIPESDWKVFLLSRSLR